MNFNFLKKANKDVYDKKTLTVLSVLFGVSIGDALGVPVEFEDRSFRQSKPVKDMFGYGTHNMPAGTWSDDSSLTFCLAESLCLGFNTDDIGNKFVDWYYNEYWTPDNKLPFDVGRTTCLAIMSINIGVKAEEAGEKDEKNNGNGSLMRILPLVFYLENYDGNKFEVIEKVSAITHGHIRSKIACSIYIEIALNMLKGLSPQEAYKQMKFEILTYYSSKGYTDELNLFDRILENDIFKLSVADIKSSGYVIDTLEASLWCFLRANNYSEAVLSAVNLGGDTDTIGAICGGLAGLYFGFQGIPSKWVTKLARKNDIIELAKKLSKNI